MSMDLLHRGYMAPVCAQTGKPSVHFISPLNYAVAIKDFSPALGVTDGPGKCMGTTLACKTDCILPLAFFFIFLFFLVFPSPPPPVI